MLVWTLHGRRMGVRGGGGEEEEEGGGSRRRGGGGGRRERRGEIERRRRRRKRRGRGRGRETSPYVALNQLVETQVMYARRNPRLWEFLWCMQLVLAPVHGNSVTNSRFRSPVHKSLLPLLFSSSRFSPSLILSPCITCISFEHFRSF
jgi:hypothetical protein